MKRFVHPILTISLASGFLASAQMLSAVELPSFFSDGMILQREKGAKLWGTAGSSSSVTVSFAGRTWNTVAAADGRFEVVLDNLAASSVERDLEITADGETDILTGVLVGEVWLGAGQSNMEFPFSFLESIPTNEAEIASANDPLLRIYLPTEQARENPVDDIQGSWISAVSGELPDLPAFPYYVAKRLRDELGVPVAIMECAWGGQRIEGFMSEEALETFPDGRSAIAAKEADYAAYEAFEIALAAWQANPVGPAPQPPGDDPRFEPSLAGQIYNGMIAPMAGYGVRGILFYQGEANTFFFSPDEYHVALEALVDDWRNAWGEELPFYYMQLANFVTDSRPKWVNVQNEQRIALNNISNAGMTVGNDIGNPVDIHPANKADFADRIVRWPLRNEYGQTNLIPTGPLYLSSTISGNSITIQFDYSDGLTTSNGQALSSFQVRSGSNNWVNATATISGEAVIVSAGSVPNPTEVRYAWSQDPSTANLVNSAGLPASVFVDSPNQPGVDPITVTASADPINEGLIGLAIEFTLSEPAQGGEAFNFTLAPGTATPGEDYVNFNGVGVVDFAAGETSQTIFMSTIDDSIVEPDETFSILFSNPSSGLELAQSSLQLVILNDDEDDGPVDPVDPPLVTASAAPINEGFIGLPIELTLSEPALGGEQFSFALVEGTALSGEDYIDWPGGLVVFEAGETSQTLFMTMIDDTIVEPDESFTIQFFNPSGVELAQNSLELVILNDDDEDPVDPVDPVDSGGPLVVTVTTFPTNEGVIGMPVEFTFSRPAQGGEQFNFALFDNSASADEDYVDWPNGLIVLQPGETSHTLNLTLVDDSIPESEEVFDLQLFNFSGLQIPETSFELVILDDDEDTGGPVDPGEPEDLPTFTASASPTNEGLIGMLVEVTLSAPATGGEFVDFALVAGSANPFEDYLPFNGGRFEFSAGDTSQTLILTMVDDAIAEPNETFSIQFSNSSGLELPQDSLELTIVNDDSVLDEYGDQYGLPTEERGIFSDGDGDGLGVFIEYAFNLNPTVAESPVYVPGVTLDEEGEPFGIPSVISRKDPVTGSQDIIYLFIRRTDSFPKVEYFTELSSDNVNFATVTPDKVTTLSDHWEEVEVIIGGDSKPELTSCFARVRVVAEDDNGDGF